MKIIFPWGSALLISALHVASANGAPPSDAVHICGTVTSMAAPAEIEGKAALFNFALTEGCKGVRPGSDYSFGVRRQDPNALAMLAVVQAAFAKGKCLLVTYNPPHPTPIQIQIQATNCPPDFHQ